MSSLLPVIEQLQGAASDCERAALLLSCPDAVLIKYREVFTAACRRASFDFGAEFVELRTAAMCATRDAHGLLPGELAGLLEDMRRALSDFCASSPPAGGWPCGDAADDGRPSVDGSEPQGFRRERPPPLDI